MVDTMAAVRALACSLLAAVSLGAAAEPFAVRVGEARLVLDAPAGFLAALRRAAHHHEVVRIPHQFAQMPAVSGPHPVQHVQVDVRQQR